MRFFNCAFAFAVTFLFAIFFILPAAASDFLFTVLAPFFMAWVVFGAALGNCSTVSLVICTVSPAVTTVSYNVAAVSSTIRPFSICLAVSLTSMVVSLAAVAASCTASTKSVIAPLLRKGFYSFPCGSRKLTNSFCSILYWLCCFFSAFSETFIL